MSDARDLLTVDDLDAMGEEIAGFELIDGKLVPTPSLIAPDMAIKLVTPSKSEAELRLRKVPHLQVGSAPVWTVHPEQRTATIVFPRRARTQAPTRRLGRRRESDPRSYPATGRHRAALLSDSPSARFAISSFPTGASSLNFIAPGRRGLPERVLEPHGGPHRAVHRPGEQPMGGCFGARQE